MHSLLLLISLIVIPCSADGLHCSTCNSVLECKSPRVEKCPSMTHCYFLWKDADPKQIIRMGCAASCEDVGIFGHSCKVCYTDECNSGDTLFLVSC
ncbi:hypothetical protein AB6A40_009373 [Gnathostoma spinigerum]|uniref:Uncharacterized protein n=1 Tax=Gnathostoma spinigerum TaxID=75299 RepID=A0ABD6ERT1_9BILA